MSIIDRLKETYTTKSTLTIPDLRINLDFKYEESLDKDTKSAFSEGLRELGIGIVYIENSFLDPISVSIGKENNIPFFRLDNGNVYRFPGKNPIDAMLWSAYSLAAQSNWLPDEKDCDVQFLAYNAGSQKFAASVLYEVENRLRCTPNIAKNVKSIMEEYPQKFYGLIPKFSHRILTEDGFEAISSTKGLFKKSEKTELRELAGKLYGDREFEDDISVFLDYIKKSHRYLKFVDTSTSKCLEELLKLPLYRLKESIEETKIKLLSEKNPKKYFAEAKEELKAKSGNKKLTPSEIFKEFMTVDEKYQKAAEDTFYLMFLTDFCARLTEKIAEPAKKAFEEMRVISGELRNFCRINPNDYGTKITWTDTGEISAESLSVNDKSWDANSIQAAQKNTILPVGYYTKKWFAGENVAETAKEAGVLQLDSVYSLDSELLCVLFFKTNTEGETQ